MKKVAASLLIAVVLMLTVAFAAFAQPQQEQVGSCPPVFELHEIDEHTEHEDHHIGTHQDKNGDGHICVKHLDNGLHVHVDNRLPLDE